MILKDSFAAFKAHEQKEEKVKEQIKKKEKQLKRLERSPKSSWVSTLLHPLAQAMAEKLGRKEWEIMGPFGLGCETSIWFWDTPEERNELKIDSITVVPDYQDYDEREPNPFGIRIKDYSKNTGRFPEGSIGERNGGNFSNVIPPLDADVNWFVSKASRDKDEEKK